MVGIIMAKLGIIMVGIIMVGIIMAKLRIIMVGIMAKLRIIMAEVDTNELKS